MHPTAGSFGTYAEIYLNPWAGWIARYSYWMAQVIAVGGESGGGRRLHDILFSRHAGVAVVVGFRLRAALLQFPIGQ